MRRIYLLRHAKSSWDDPSLPDAERPLAPRGRKAARRMTEHLRAEGIRPEVVLCSTARRAIETLEAIRPALGDASTETEDALYAADEDRLLSRLRDLPDAVASVMVIGHNPGLQDLGLLLAASGEDPPGFREKFPTGALATLETDVERWSDLRSAQARIVGLVTPRDLG